MATSAIPVRSSANQSMTAIPAVNPITINITTNVHPNSTPIAAPFPAVEYTSTDGRPVTKPSHTSMTHLPQTTSESIPETPMDLGNKEEPLPSGFVPIMALQVSPQLQVVVAGTRCNCVVDTGSAVTVLSTKRYHHPLPEQSTWRLRSATGHDTPLLGPSELDFVFNANTRVTFPTFMALIPDDCVIGADFLHLFKGQIDMEGYRVRIVLPVGTHVVLPCAQGPSRTPCRLVRVLRTAVPFKIQGRQEVVLTATLDRAKVPGRVITWNHCRS